MHVKVAKLIVGAIVITIATQVPFECRAALNSYEMNQLDCTFNEKYFDQNQSGCSMKVEDGRNKYARGHSELIKTVDEPVVTIEVYMGSSLANDQYNLLFTFSQNVCHLADEANASFIASIARLLWETYTNVPFRCPIQPGKYFVSDIDYNTLAQMIPITVPSGPYKLEIKAHHKSELVLSITTVVTVDSITAGTTTTASATSAATTALLKKLQHIN